MKTIYILLSRTQPILSRTVRLVTLDTYTHTAIAFNWELEVFCGSTHGDGETLFSGGSCRGYTNQVRPMLMEVLL